MDPNFPLLRTRLRLAYEAKGMFEEAIAELQRAVSLRGENAHTMALLAHGYAAAGRKEEAHKVLEQIRELSQRRYVSAYGISTVYAGLGETDLALEWLEKACEDRDSWLFLMRVDPHLQGLRADLRFTELVRRIGLQP
ncbi:MAG: tetratricopeptide repeat protein [Acidobacteria bacterium]|nr:tetratricopeptide repeat protein [Acidobacteriota bacterium]